MTLERNLSMQNNRAELVRVLGEASSFLEASSLPPELSYKANLVLEEMLTNIVKYAFPDGGFHDVAIHMMLKDQELILQFVEDGIDFNPLLCPPPQMSESVLDAPVGGLGIYLVCNTVDRIEYRREGGMNILTVGLKREIQPNRSAR